MVSIIVKEEEYKEIKNYMPEIFPDLKFELKTKDFNLKILGLSESAPCAISFDTDREGYENILNELSQIETDAFAAEEENSAEYLRYERYKNLWPILFNAINSSEAAYD